MIQCQYCRTMNQDTMNRCARCGRPLKRMEPAQGPVMVTFARPNHFQYAGAKYSITIDNQRKVELKNNSCESIPLPKGPHTVEISVFGMVQKKKFTINIIRNTTLVCEPKRAGMVTWMATPVTVVDQSTGQKY